MRRKTGKKKNSSHFWNKEYAKGDHLALSDEPSEDFLKFLRFIERRFGLSDLNVTNSALDLGCGNGRNLIHLARMYEMKCTGFDISDTAIKQAKANSEGLPISYEARSIAEPLPLPDHSQALALDMMTSHFLKKNERKSLINEIVRVLKPGGWLYYKTFFLEEDRHAKRLLREHPGDEEGSYVHPEIGIEEHVSTEDEIMELLSPHFIVHKFAPSHRHLKKGKAHKRRSVSVYAQIDQFR